MKIKEAKSEIIRLKLRVAYLEGLMDGIGYKPQHDDSHDCEDPECDLNGLPQKEAMEVMARSLSKEEKIPLQKARQLISSSDQIRDFEKKIGIKIDRGSSDDN